MQPLSAHSADNVTSTLAQSLRGDLPGSFALRDRSENADRPAGGPQPKADQYGAAASRGTGARHHERRPRLEFDAARTADRHRHRSRRAAARPQAERGACDWRRRGPSTGSAQPSETRGGIGGVASRHSPARPPTGCCPVRTRADPVRRPGLPNLCGRPPGRHFDPAGAEPGARAVRVSANRSDNATEDRARDEHACRQDCRSRSIPAGGGPDRAEQCRSPSRPVLPDGGRCCALAAITRRA